LLQAKVAVGGRCVWWLKIDCICRLEGTIQGMLAEISQILKLEDAVNLFLDVLE
jgi:hypothetical protein